MPSLPILVVAFGGRVFGVNPQTGQHVWAYEGETVGQSMELRVLVDGQRVYTTCNSELVILEYLTGRVLARNTVPGGASGALMIVEGRLYSAGNGAITCFSLEGALLWNDEFKGMGYGTVALGVPGYVVQADKTG